MSDQISTYIQTLEDELELTKRHLASWRSFSRGKGNLPIVTYNASVDGVKALDAASDLSKLPEAEQNAIGAMLADFHGEQCLLALGMISSTSKQFASMLTNDDSGEDDETPETEYPEPQPADDSDEFE